ncbi:hypothetical protein HYALB_00008029 [Hymenoscyphus albidus]|uniref:Uncharacterized protein n=1 Tax=Hymenoscyphus albidus TaxID=595503 RepID=A0A9N9LEE2_9HELO|nr:hypothetical protein HYALB_00008029 [Hymenoscyphus albidus]
MKSTVETIIDNGSKIKRRKFSIQENSPKNSPPKSSPRRPRSSPEMYRSVENYEKIMAEGRARQNTEFALKESRRDWAREEAAKMPHLPKFQNKDHENAYMNYLWTIHHPDQPRRTYAQDAYPEPWQDREYTDRFGYLSHVPKPKGGWPEYR